MRSLTTGPGTFTWRVGGVYVAVEPFKQFCADLARETGGSASGVAPYALAQLVRHESVHFQMEVEATQMEEICASALYVPYVRSHYNDSAVAQGVPCEGPLEEALATWAEVEYARSAKRRASAMSRYPAAVQTMADRLPAGYKDWRIFERALANRPAGLMALAALFGIVRGSDPVNSARLPRLLRSELL